MHRVQTPALQMETPGRPAPSPRGLQGPPHSAPHLKISIKEPCPEDEGGYTDLKGGSKEGLGAYTQQEDEGGYTDLNGGTKEEEESAYTDLNATMGEDEDAYSDVNISGLKKEDDAYSEVNIRMGGEERAYTGLCMGGSKKDRSRPAACSCLSKALGMIVLLLLSTVIAQSVLIFQHSKASKETLTQAIFWTPSPVTTVSQEMLTEKLYTVSTVSQEMLTEKLDTVSAVSQEMMTEKLDTVSAVSQEMLTERLNTISVVSQEMLTEKLDIVSAVSQKILTETLDTASTISQEMLTEKLNTVGTVSAEMLTEKLDTVSTESQEMLTEKMYRSLSLTLATLKAHLCVESDSPCQVCPNSWKQNNGWCYYISNEKQSWNFSDEYCSARHSHLLMLDSEEEMGVFLQKELSENVWIGLRYNEEEDQLVWSNGSPLNTTSFTVNNWPNGTNCTALAHSEIYLDECQSHHKWICQKRAYKFDV